MTYNTLKELNNKFLSESVAYSCENKILSLIHLFYWMETNPKMKRKARIYEIEALKIKIPKIDFSN